MTRPPLLVLAATLTISFAAARSVAAQATDRIEGIVVDVLGEPIPKASIVVAIRDHEPVRTTCDGLGRFVAAQLPRGAFMVTASADGHCANWEEVESADGAIDASIRIELLDAVRVEGRVVDAGGDAVPGAHVVVDADWKLLDESDTHAVTNAEGRYLLPRVPVGDVCLIALAARQMVTGEPMTLHRPVTHDFRLKAGPSATYRIDVEGVGADDWRSMRVFCQHRFSGNDTDWQFGAIWSRARDGNTIVLADVPVDLGLESISLWTSGTWAQPDWKAVPSTPGVHAFSMKVVNDTPAATPAVVQGVVLDVAGRPVPGLRIGQCTWRVTDETRTGPDGTFALATSIAGDDRVCLGLVDNDDYRIVSDRDPRSDGVLVVRHEVKQVHKIVVDRVARVAGSIVDADGTPVFGAEVELLVDAHQHRPDVNGAPSTKIAITRTRRDGRFALPRLDGHLDFDVWLSVSSTAGRLQHGPLRLQAGRTVDLGILGLARPGTIEGVYTDEKGHPQPGFSVNLCRQDTMIPTASWWFGHSNRDGRFRFTGLPDGDYRVRPREPFAARWAPAPDFARVALKAGERVVVRRGDDLR